jgi:8-oxo-dGTP pyrophosphatase MutT (NUDIX family)
VSTFRTVASSHHYRGFSSVRVDVLHGPAGTFTREVVEHPDAVAVVALDDALRVALVLQYRHPLGAALLELPAGTLDIAGEDTIAAAHRELAEEVGLAAEELVPLGVVWNSAGWSDERTHLFLARRTAPTSRPAGFEAVDEEADMTVLWRPLDDLVRAALTGELTDAKTVVGVLRADAVIRRGRADASG